MDTAVYLSRDDEKLPSTDPPSKLFITLSDYWEAYEYCFYCFEEGGRGWARDYVGAEQGHVRGEGRSSRSSQGTT